MIRSVVLGIIQGLTEFLPVSSSGHLILGASLFGLEAPGLSFSIILHVGTALATIIMLRDDIASIFRGLFGPKGAERSRAFQLVGFTVLASFPAALAGLLAGDVLENMYFSQQLAALGLVGTGLLLVLNRPKESERGVPGALLGTVTGGKAFAVGLGQAVAVIPGVSRSGTTIVTAMSSGVSREDAARFSFLLSLPAVFGAALLDLRKALSEGLPLFSGEHVVGGAVSFVVGLFALSVVFRAVRRGKLSKFGPYCLIVGAGFLVFSLIQGF